MPSVIAQALKKLRKKSWEGIQGTPKEESLEAISENRHRGCGRDMLGQTVPSTRAAATGKARSLTVDSQPCMSDIQRLRGSRLKASPGLEISDASSVIVVVVVVLFIFVQ